MHKFYQSKIINVIGGKNRFRISFILSDAMRFFVCSKRSAGFSAFYLNQIACLIIIL